MKRLTRFSIRTIFVVTLVCAGVAFGARDHVIAVWSNWTSIPPSFASTEPNAWDSVESMHAFYTKNFVESEGFGLARRIEFNAPERRSLMVNGERYRIESAQLVGLRNQPVVYDSNWAAPQFDGSKHLERLVKAETRSLSADEEKVILRLRLGKRYVWLPGDDEHPPMLYGALRASTTCAQCHEVDNGTLLGAFAYTLLSDDYQLEKLLKAERLRTPQKVAGDS